MSFEPEPGADPIQENLVKDMNDAMDELMIDFPPPMIVALFVIDPVERRFNYISNGDRTDMLAAIQAWMDKQRKLS